MPQTTSARVRHNPAATVARATACAGLVALLAQPLVPLHAASLPQPVPSSSRFT
ncbi:MAG: hypothetical protein ABL977_06200 [Candidatus Eisenbacteria bacterium]